MAFNDSKFVLKKENLFFRGIFESEKPFFLVIDEISREYVGNLKKYQFGIEDKILAYNVGYDEEWSINHLFDEKNADQKNFAVGFSNDEEHISNPYLHSSLIEDSVHNYVISGNLMANIHVFLVKWSTPLEGFDKHFEGTYKMKLDKDYINNFTFLN
jgi:hypothetical protein